MSNSIDDEFKTAIAEFVGAFETVFRYDWPYTRIMIGVWGDGAEGTTFLEPGLADESDDWAARGELLQKYRELVRVLKQRGVSPEFPIPLERFPDFKRRVW